MRRQRIEEENWGGNEEARYLGSRAAPPSVARLTLSFKVSIYCRLGKGGRLFLGNSVIKPYQTHPNAKGFSTLVTEGKEIFLSQIYEAEHPAETEPRKSPRQNDSSSQRRKIYFYHLYSASSSLLFPHRAMAISFMVLHKPCPRRLKPPCRLSLEKGIVLHGWVLCKVKVKSEAAPFSHLLFTQEICLGVCKTVHS